MSVIDSGQLGPISDQTFEGDWQRLLQEATNASNSSNLSISSQPESSDPSSQLWFGLYRVSPFNLEDGAPELYVLFIVQVFFAFKLLNKINGNPDRLISFLFYTPSDLPILYSKCSICMLKLITTFFFISPFITLYMSSIIFSIQAFEAFKANTYLNIYFLFIALPGTAILLLAYTLRLMKWNQYAFTCNHCFAILVSYICFTLWQYILIFKLSDPTLVGISAFFLTQDLFVACSYTLMIQSLSQFDMQSILKTYIQSQNTENDYQMEIDPLRQIPLEEEIQNQKKDKQWQVTMPEINDICTFNSSKNHTVLFLFDNQILVWFKHQKQVVQHIVIFFLVLLNLGILMAYAWTVQAYLQSSIGMLYAITIFAFDIVVFWLSASGVVRKQSRLVAMLFLIRYLMFMTGKERWIFGYISVYFFISIYLSIKSVKAMLPYSFNLTKTDIKSLKEPKSDFWQKLFSQPIAMLVFCTLLIFSILSGLKLIKIKGVTLRHIEFVNNKTLSAFETFWLAVLVVMSFFFGFSLYRSVNQRLLKFPVREYFMGTCSISYYKLLFVINWAIHLCLALFFYWLTDSKLVRECIWIGSAFLLVALHATTCYIKNSFAFFQKVTRLNKVIKANNILMKETTEKAVDIRKAILDGNEQMVPEGKLELAQKLTQQHMHDNKEQLLKSRSFHSQQKSRSLQFLSCCRCRVGYRRQQDQDGLTADRMTKIAIQNQNDQDEEANETVYYYQEKLIQDWRDSDINACQAFFQCKARNRDYKVILFFLLAHILIVGLAVIVNLYTGVGIVLVLPQGDIYQIRD